jgi:hypothetical protein
MAHSAAVFFLAHAGSDREIAKELCDLLEPEIPVILDSSSLEAGGSWDLELPRLQRQALATVALLSSNTETAYYLREEIAAAIAFERAEPARHRLIPVYLNGIPKDVLEIPYGLRVRHSLDAVALGLAGVADELRKLAAGLDGLSPPPFQAGRSKAADRFAVFNALCRLLPTQFEEILFRLQAPRQHLAPPGEPLARRALDLIQWTELEGPVQSRALSDAIRVLVPGVFR